VYVKDNPSRLHMLASLRSQILQLAQNQCHLLKTAPELEYFSTEDFDFP